MLSMDRGYIYLIYAEGTDASGFVEGYVGKSRDFSYFRPISHILGKVEKTKKLVQRLFSRGQKVTYKILGEYSRKELDMQEKAWVQQLTAEGWTLTNTYLMVKNKA